MNSWICAQRCKDASRVGEKAGASKQEKAQKSQILQFGPNLIKLF
jgi:hypothetical protein